MKKTLARPAARGLLLGFALIGLLAPGRAKDEGWPQYRGGPDHNNYRKVKDEIEVPKVLWKLDWSPVPAVVGNEVYAGGTALRLVDLETGEVRASWTQGESEEEGPRNFRCTPVVLEDRVIAHGKDGAVHALSRDLSELLWSKDVAAAGFHGVSDGEVYVVSAGDRLMALEVGDGSERWDFRLSRLAGIEMTPAIAEGKVLVGSKNNTFYALDVESGEEVWSFEGEKAFGWTDPVVAYGTVFVGDRGGVIHAFDLKNGNPVWSHVSGVTGLSEPGILPGNILVGFGKYVGTFDAKSGKPDPKGRGFRTASNPFGSPTLVGKTLYFGNLDGHLYAYAYKNEQYKWAFEVGAEQQVHDFVYHRKILLVSTTEGLYALGNDPKKRKLPKKFVLIADQE